MWWARSDLNRGPNDYESSALTAELRALPSAAKLWLSQCGDRKSFPPCHREFGSTDFNLSNTIAGQWNPDVAFDRSLCFLHLHCRDLTALPGDVKLVMTLAYVLFAGVISLADVAAPSHDLVFAFPLATPRRPSHTRRACWTSNG